MNRFYTRSAIFKHGLLRDLVNEVFCIFWDNKKKKHNIILWNHVINYCKGDTSHFGTPVVFENEEHEKEFLLYHPDAKELRRYYRYGYWYVCTPCAYNEDKLPFEFKHGRWVWKK